MSETIRGKRLRVVVAALTRRRPEMLRRLIGSFGSAEIPGNCTVSFLIVENDDDPDSRLTVEAQRPLANGATLDYVHEAELGIPFGRNRAAREALGAKADLLAFVDDDEIVARDWLVRMIDGYRNSEAMLLGGPLRVQDTPDDLTFVQRLMARSARNRYLRKEIRAARKASLRGTPGVTIVTNNWLGETALFSKHGIWFDETMRFTGGTDAKFSADVKALGLPTAWVADAAVYEDIPRERLSFVYQYRRGRDQSATNFHRKLDRNRRAKWSVILSVPLKLLSILLLIIALPFTRGGTLLDIARSAGWISGRLGALLGRRSDLYKTVTGN